MFTTCKHFYARKTKIVGTKPPASVIKELTGKRQIIPVSGMGKSLKALDFETGFSGLNHLFMLWHILKELFDGTRQNSFRRLHQEGHAAGSGCTGVKRCIYR